MAPSDFQSIEAVNEGGLGRRAWRQARLDQWRRETPWNIPGIQKTAFSATFLMSDEELMQIASMGDYIKDLDTFERFAGGWSEMAHYGEEIVAICLESMKLGTGEPQGQLPLSSLNGDSDLQSSASHQKRNGTMESSSTNGSAKPTDPKAWTPSSWTSKPAKQQIVYDDRAAVGRALAKLRKLPPIVTPMEIVKLKKSLRDVALGKAFLLQGGDCAELFDYCEEEAISSKIKLLLQMSLVLIWGSNKPVVRIARMAGQFAKPRSSPMEMYEGREIHSFRGDNINGYDPADRKPDPTRLVAAYFHSASTANYLRASLASGIADLRSPMDWDLGHVRDEVIKAQYQRIVESIGDSLRFMHTVGADTAASGLETVDLYTSHEGLLLEYEQALTRRLKHPSNRKSEVDGQKSLVSGDGKGWYNTSAHFLWVSLICSIVLVNNS